MNVSSGTGTGTMFEGWYIFIMIIELGHIVVFFPI